MKKGFTLIEIIVSITLIVIIGVGSLVGVRYIINKVRINRLNQITDKVIQAAEVYLESNNEARTHLYNNGEGVVIPIKLLVNEGLLTLENTDIKESDYEKEYVVTALGSTTQSEKCVTITTNASWNLNATTPLYICTDSSGNQNLKTVSQTEFSNKMTISNGTFYFKGQLAENYAKISGSSKEYRIVSVDKNDRITLYSAQWNDTFTDINSTLYTNRFNTPSPTPKFFVVGCVDGNLLLVCSSNCTSNQLKFYRNTSVCKSYISDDRYIAIDSWTIGYTVDYLAEHNYINHPDNSGREMGFFGDAINVSGSTIKLIQSMKITSGTGTPDDPYIIEQKN